MARRPRLNAAGTFHHVITRGNNRDDIFYASGDRLRFLNLLETAVFEYKWRCHAYCLMTNHYHLLVETREPTLAEGMCLLNGQYSRDFNKHYKRSGHLFERRYFDKLVKGEAQFKENARYIVNNPVRARICDTADGYLWSSHLATLGQKTRHGCLTTSFLLRQFGPEPRGARAAYRRFVDAAMEVGAPRVATRGARHVPGAGYATAARR